MEPYTQSQTFFVISSVGFILLTALVSVLLIYAIRAMEKFRKIMDRVEKDIDSIGDTTKEMLEDVRHSTVFHLLFKRKKTRKSEK